MTDSKAFKKQLLSLLIPLALENLLNAFIGVSDVLMLGHYNEESISAVSLANQISFVMMLFTGAITGAAGVLIAQYHGKREYHNARCYLSMALRYCIYISLLFFIITFFFPEELMNIFTHDEELIEIGSRYLKIVSFSYLFQAEAHCFFMMMKISGYAKWSVLISLVTVVLDITIDHFLVYGYKGIPALGAEGTAYSTIFVEIVSLVWCAIFMLKHDEIRLRYNELNTFNKEYERSLWKVAAGMLISSLSWGLSITMHHFILGHIGSAATAAASIVSISEEMIECVTLGISSSAGIMIGELLGQGKLDEAKDYGKRFFKVALYSGILNVILTFIAWPLCDMFFKISDEAKTYLTGMHLYSALYMFAYAFNTIIACGIFEAGGDSKYDAISVFFATWCFSIPLAILSAFVFHLPVVAVFIIMCLDEIVKIPFIPWRYKKYIWVKDLTVEETNS